MATYKLEVKKQYGQLQHRVYPSHEAAPDFAGAASSITNLLDEVGKTLDGAAIGKADTVIFRQIGYESRGDLREAVRTATY